MQDRPYQSELHAAIREAVREGHTSILVQSGTGTGKTNIGCRLMQGAARKGHGSIFLAPRRDLVTQTAERLARFDVEAGIIMAGERMHAERLPQVASFDTLHARAIRSSRIALPDARVVVPDEAHLSTAETRQDIIRAFPNAITVGLTATPATQNGRPLAGLYTKLITGWPIGRMVDEGYLVGTRYYAPSQYDLKNVRSRGGDYVVADLEGAVAKPELIGDIVENWLRIAFGTPTVVFCVTRKHAKAVLDEFRRAGVRAEYVDGETKKDGPDGRDAIYARVAAGITTVLVNVFVASYGLDIPPLATCVIARPTKSLVLYHQMVGRILRPLYADWATPELLESGADLRREAIADSVKPFARVIDHTGAVLLHGFVDEEVPWTLSGDQSVSDAIAQRQKERGEPKLITCPKCKKVFSGTKFCPGCGHELIKPGEPIPCHKADLQELDRSGNAANRKTPWTEKAAFFGQAKHYARSKGFSDGWAAHLYCEKFGTFPNDPRIRDAAPRVPDNLLVGFIKHRAMKKKFSKGVAA